MVFFLAILVVSVRSALQLWKLRAVLAEFRASRAIAFVALLYPAGVVSVMLLPLKIGFVGAAIVGLAAFVPGIVLSRAAQKKLQLAGTDRVQRAEEVAATVFMTGVGCMLYFCVDYGIAIASQSSADPFK